MLSVIIQSAILLNVIAPLCSPQNSSILSVIVLSVVIQSAIVSSVMAPQSSKLINFSDYWFGIKL